MKKSILAVFLLFALTSSYSQVFVEDFNDEADDATSGTATGGTWSTACTGCGTAFSKQTLLGVEYFQAGDNLDTEGVWTSNVIDISGFRDVAVYIETGTLATEAGDYLNVYYRLNGGAEVLFHSQATGTSNSTGLSTTLNGSTLQIVVRAFNNQAFDFFTFDNIVVTNTLFSAVAAGNWETAGSWSLLGVDQTVCGGCTPNNFTNVVIGGADVITIGAAASVASLKINGTADALGAGTLTYSGNFALNVDQSGSITVNSGGQITNGGNASSAITYTDDQNHTIINNGSITIGDLIVTTALLGNPTITLSGSGSTTVSDELDLNGSLLTPDFINSSTGAFSVGGATRLRPGTFTDTDNTSVTTFTGNVALSGTAPAFTSTVVATSGNLVFRGGIDVGAGTFAAGGATFNTNNQTISGNTELSFANFVVVTGVTVTNNNTGGVSLTRVPGGVTLTGTGTWTQGANSILNYTGTSIGITTFLAGNPGNTVNYNSTTSAQTIRVPAGSTYSRLTFNNTSVTAPQLTMQGSIIVSSILTFTAGRVNMSGYNITLSPTTAGALVHGLTSASGWMYGGNFIRTRPASTVITVGTAHSLFPLGSSGDWRPFFVGQTSDPNTAGTITVSHTNSTSTSNVSINDGVMITRRHDSFWSLSTSGISAGATFALRAGGTNFGTIEAGAGDIRMSTTTGVVGSHVAGTGGPTDWRVNRGSVTFGGLANNFHVASTDNVNSPLPVELVSFAGEVVKNGIQLKWETSSELNNDFFNVERSADGETFSTVGEKIKGAGTTNQARSYNLVDQSPLYGTSYYRLKQTDFDGTFSFSKIISVTYDGPVFPVMNVYPNPTKGDFITIKIEGLKNMETVPVIIYDQVGKAWMTKVLAVDQNTQTAAGDLVFDKQLPKGMYLVKAGPSQIQVAKFVVYEK